MSDSKNKSLSPPLHVYAVEATNGKTHWLKMREIPLIGDTIIIDDEGIFKVIERGQIADAIKLSCGWIRLEEIVGRNVAPGIMGYDFMERFSEGKS